MFSSKLIPNRPNSSLSQRIMLLRVWLPELFLVQFDDVLVPSTLSSLSSVFNLIMPLPVYQVIKNKNVSPVEEPRVTWCSCARTRHSERIMWVWLGLPHSFIAVNDYFTFFYVKHFELPMCMKCAIQINLPCLAYQVTATRPGTSVPWAI